MTAAALAEKLRADAAAMLTDSVMRDVTLAIATLGHPVSESVQRSIDAFNYARYLSFIAEQLESRGPR